jgi:RNA polymerase sigma factor (sigma-70 family)
MGSESKSPLVRIVDDDEGVRQSSAFLLGAAGYETACYESADDFLKHDDPARPGCLLLDARMPGMTGLELQDLLDSRGFRIPVIFVTGHGDVDMAVHVLKQGAADFLQKPVDGDRLIAVERVEADERDNADRAAFETLTAREKEVVKLVAEGLQNKEIAEKLNIAEKTVKVHRGSATRKLNVRNGVDIATLLRRIGVMN